MIARLWTAHTTPALADSYLQHFDNAVRPEIRKINGFLGASVGIRPSPGSVEILVTTYWQSFEAIDVFAGADREAAVVAAEAAALLTDYDKRVRHYELALKEFPPAR
jgi:heme-degrading monooxygenase HmoA